VLLYILIMEIHLHLKEMEYTKPLINNFILNLSF
jgi:hypothetical protein